MTCRLQATGGSYNISTTASPCSGERARICPDSTFSIRTTPRGSPCCCALLDVPVWLAGCAPLAASIRQTTTCGGPRLRSRVSLSLSVCLSSASAFSLSGAPAPVAAMTRTGFRTGLVRVWLPHLSVDEALATCGPCLVRVWQGVCRWRRRASSGSWPV